MMDDLHIASSSPSSHTIIVGVTGNALSEDIDAFMQAGADAVFVKPLNIQELFSFLQRKHFVIP
jgi:CheY-like chemotaxis protein